MLLLDFLQVGAIVTGVIGQILVAEKKVSGFVFWMLTNVCLAGIAIEAGTRTLILLYAFQTAMCIYSMWKWKRLERQNPFA